MRKSIVLPALLLAALILTASIVWYNIAARSRPKPGDTIAAFESAFNRYDLDGMVNCLDPSLADTAKDIVSLVSGDKWNLSTVSALAKAGIPLLPIISDNLITSEDLPKLLLSVSKMEIRDANAVCEVSGAVSVIRHSFDFSQQVKLIRLDQMWYISKVTD
ncbi:MAG: hypothetical protein LBR98_07115 [Syntrophomonadaceae bacterium]|jgi:hypothetical protein|nr:hypothetical protein [Syntrophomonadaceae bacterium]